MTARERAAQYVVEIMRSQLGYREKASNADLEDPTANEGSNNYTKYAAYFDRLWNSGVRWYNTRKQGADWCDMFFDWAQCQAWGWETALPVLYQTRESCGAGCEFSAAYYRANGAWIPRSGEPKPGDQIFFGPEGDETHTGGVSRVTETRVYTVEGNANDRVVERSYSRSSSLITGYGRPDYALVQSRFEEAPGMSKEEIQAMIDASVSKAIERSVGKWIETIRDVPHDSVKRVTQTLLDLEAVDGGTDYAIDPDDIRLPYNILRAIVIATRYTDLALADAADG